MLEYVRGGASPRQLQLLAVACVRRVWRLLTDERGRRVVEVAERFADGRATREEGEEAVRAARKFCAVTAVRSAADLVPLEMIAAAVSILTEEGAGAARCAWHALQLAAPGAQCGPLRDVFG